MAAGAQALRGAMPSGDPPVEGTSPSGKTAIYSVSAKDGGATLGAVRWYAPWRKYAFFPRPETLYEQDCLRDIAAFCEAETRAHRERKAS